jgi:phage tail sheath protein FI
MLYTRRTPGVYITELAAFPPSIVGIPTAVPAFIGYTQKADISGKPVFMKPIKIGSMADYREIFGAEYDPLFNLVEVTDDDDKTNHNYDFKVFEQTSAGPPIVGTWRFFNLLRPVGESDVPRFNLYNSMRLFYANGGGNCYVVSVAPYKNKPDGAFNAVALDKLEAGLAAIGEEVGPTMLVIPEAVLLPRTSGEPNYKSADYKTLVDQMLGQCFALKDRVAILDPYGTQYINQVIQGETAVTTWEDVVDQFRKDVDVPNELLSYGMAYFPFLDTTVIPLTDFDYTNISPLTDVDPLKPTLTKILTWENTNLYGTSDRATAVQADIDAILQPNPTPAGIAKLNQNLIASLPLLGDMERIIVAKSDRLPTSPAMAGVYTFIDSTRGVWNAPANIGLVSVNRTTFKLNNNQQGDLNMPVNGKAINAIREFVGRGNIVWGARTLDGNSNDYRYIQVRRTLIYIEQSIKSALNTFVFAPNDGNTWVTVTSMVSNFLQGVWSAGGLMGAKESDAFTVQCGLGSTMTGLDILNGYMIVQVTLQMIHPAEFIELTFKQKMEGVS